jgi:hypothetical protein
MPRGSWWGSKVRRTLAYLGARVTAEEWASLRGWLTPAQLALFARMSVPDQRHGLDVVAALRRAGVDDPDLLVAGLLHDAGKGDVGLAARVLAALAARYGDAVVAPARWIPPLRRALRRLRRHPERSAELARRAGCSPRVVQLIRWQEEPRDLAGHLLHWADEVA